MNNPTFQPELNPTLTQEQKCIILFKPDFEIISLTNSIAQNTQSSHSSENTFKISDLLPHTTMYDIGMAIKALNQDNTINAIHKKNFSLHCIINRQCLKEYLLSSTDIILTYPTTNNEIISDHKTEAHFEYSPQKNQLYINVEFSKLINDPEKKTTISLSKWMSQIYEEDRKSFKENLDKLIYTPGPFEFEIRHLVKKGRPLWYKISGTSTLAPQTEDVVLFGKAVDITEFKTEIEQLKNDKQRALKSNLFKSHFLRKLSHQVRTPLNSISGFSGMILEDGFTKVEKKEFMSIIERNSDQLVNTISDYIDTFRIEDGNIELHRTFFNPSILLLDIYGHYESEKIRLNKPHIKLKVDFPDNAAIIQVHADKIRFRQVFNQLLDNALKFTETGSISFGYTIKNKLLTFFVKDTGKGIDETERLRILSSFNNQPQTFEDFNVNGLGLHICKHLVELMHGQIGLKTTEGVGSTFSFSLPYTTKELPEGNNTIAKNHNKNYKWSGKKILVVDDAKEIFDFIKLTLRNTSATCLYADSGKTCIELIQSVSDVDLILLDIQMPKMNGFNTLQKVHKVAPNLPIVALTAHGLPGDKENLLEYGFTNHIAKPIKKADLFNTLKQILQ